MPHPRGPDPRGALLQRCRRGAMRYDEWAGCPTSERAESRDSPLTKPYFALHFMRCHGTSQSRDSCWARQVCNTGVALGRGQAPRHAPSSGLTSGPDDARCWPVGAKATKRRERACCSFNRRLGLTSVRSVAAQINRYRACKGLSA